MHKDLHIRQNPEIKLSEIAFHQSGHTIVDARSPNEYSQGQIPGARNISLLDDEERKIVGTLYKQKGKDKAIEEGYRVLDAKLEMLKDHFSDITKDQPIVVYCARGGMRSNIITTLMRAAGFNALQLKGGYKAFRTENIRFLEQVQIPDLVILHGKTGVSKTIVLNRLENALDLEGLADHRGSMFGGIGKHPVTQKIFDARLWKRLIELDFSKPIYVEGESRKIGPVILPSNLFNQMKKARVYLLEASLETRAKRITQEYVTDQPQCKQEIKDTIAKLYKDLGHKKVAELLEQFDRAAYDECFAYILEHYYDRKYTHSMGNPVIEKTISTEDLNQAVQQIRS